MKIHQLPLGARFVFEGQEFVKTGPMFAAGQDGGQRLIPKYAQLTVLGENASDADPKPRALTKASVLTAFEAFYSRCKELAPEDRHPELDIARDHFLRVLGLRSR